MVTLQTQVRVDDVSGQEIFDFLANPNDLAYQAWWPGVHLHFHPVEQVDGHVGDVVYMDEYIGKRRVRMHGVVVEAAPGRTLVWEMRKGIKLPVRLALELADDERGVAITHTLTAGFAGAGRLFDPLVRLGLTRSFAAAMDEHVRTEFPLLRDLLRRGNAPRHDPRRGAL